jgi:hypothetical protein
VKFEIHYSGQSQRPPEIVEASKMLDRGHEGRWIDFVDASDNLILRVPAGDVERVERFKDPGSPPQTRPDTPDLSRILA